MGNASIQANAATAHGTDKADIPLGLVPSVLTGSKVAIADTMRRAGGLTDIDLRAKSRKPALSASEYSSVGVGEGRTGAASADQSPVDPLAVARDNPTAGTSGRRQHFPGLGF